MYGGSLKGYKVSKVSERKNGNEPSDSMYGTVHPRNSIFTRSFAGSTKREITVAFSIQEIVAGRTSRFFVVHFSLPMKLDDKEERKHVAYPYILIHDEIHGLSYRKHTRGPMNGRLLVILVSWLDSTLETSTSETK